jgi:hypothetical protein
MRRLQYLRLPMVHQVPESLLRMIEASTQSALGSRAERLLALAVSPHLITAAIVAGAAAVAVFDAQDLAPWLIVVAAAAGWSSAWSP